MNNRKRKALRMLRVASIDARILEYKYFVALKTTMARRLRQQYARQLRNNPEQLKDAMQRADSWSVNSEAQKMFEEGLGKRRQRKGFTVKLDFSQYERYAYYGTDGKAHRPSKTDFWKKYEQ